MKEIFTSAAKSVFKRQISDGMLKAVRVNLKRHAFLCVAQAFRFLPLSDVEPPCCFIIGCARSGTTMLAKMLAFHPHVANLREARYIWTSISRHSDVEGLYFPREQARFRFDEEDTRPGQSQNLRKLLNFALSVRRKRFIVEKLPHNVCRIRWLHALLPSAKFVHIVRDGRSAVRSIANMAKDTQWMVGKWKQNRQWGVNDKKWKTLRPEAEQMGIAVPAAGNDTDEVRAAVEWLYSVRSGEIDGPTLADQYLQVSYERIVAAPTKMVKAIFEFLGLPTVQDALHRSKSLVYHTAPPPPRIALPPKLSSQFEADLHRLGYV
jgi:hypothetical protein